ncbi:MAG: SDR family oxidoreductase [Planctomycetaceae bacterium]|nr:SDR family oxidoreductase [Planctomycetaceae bacterium]
MDLNLKDSVVVITGGASGIGRATADQFHAEGARVSVWDLQSPEEESFDFQQVDITSADDVARATEITLSRFGRIDHLVHAAAIGSGKFGFPFDNLSPDDWPRVLEVNIMGMTRVAHAVGPVLRTQQAGTMVFISSVAGQIGSQTDPPYSAAKAANINFAQCLAKDLAPHGVRVNTVCPGMIQTPLNKSVWQAWNDRQSDDRKRSYEDWAGEKIRTVIPLGRWQTPEDIAHTILFLSSDKAAQITGQTINVDGGFVMHW